MAKSKTNQFRDAADALLEKGIRTYEEFKEALPLIRNLEEALKGVSDYRSKIDASLKGLKEKAALYAEDHVKALDGGLSDYKQGMKRGSVTLDGIVYSLTVSPGGIKRINGGNMTKEFLESLPEEWTAVKTVLDETSIKKMGVSDEKLAARGLVRETKRTWTSKEAA